MKKRVLVLSDMHCGDRAGLTPPSWHNKGDKSAEESQRVKMWNWFANSIKKLGKIDICIHNGDAIDGKGYRSGSTELITADRNEQINMATENLKYVKAKEYYLTYGTPYHTGAEEDFEKILAESLKGTIKGHLFLKVGNTVFDIKHKVGSSSTPYGRHTPVAKEKLWNTIWADRQGQTSADVLIRSHVHYFSFCGDDKYLAMTTPALQGFGSKYGVRQCSGLVNIGMVWFDVDDKGYDWNVSTMNYEIKEHGKVLEPRIK